MEFWGASIYLFVYLYCLKWRCIATKTHTQHNMGVGGQAGNIDGGGVGGYRGTVVMKNITDTR